MKYSFIQLFLILLLGSCGAGRQTSHPDYGSPAVQQSLINDFVFQIEQYSEDATYGYTEDNPIMVGGGVDGPKNERRYLNALAGPGGEVLRYERLGSCCSFRTKNAVFGNTGLLDMYKITYPGQEEEIVLYLNMYDSDTLKVPVGFTLRK